MTALLLCVSIGFIVGQNICIKELNRSHMPNTLSYFAFCIIYQLICVVIFSFGMNLGSIHRVTVVFGVVHAFLNIFTYLCYAKAFELGPYSFTTLLFSAAITVPVIVGMGFWNEKLTPLKAAGFALLALTFYLSSFAGKGGQEAEQKKKSLKWLVTIVIAFVGNGFVMVCYTGQQRATPGAEAREFLFIAYLLSAIFSLIILFYRRMKLKESIGHLKSKGFAAVSVSEGFLCGFSSLLSSFIANRVEASVQYPVVNGGVIVVATALSIFVYKESMTLKKAAALVCGLAAVILLCL